MQKNVEKLIDETLAIRHKGFTKSITDQITSAEFGINQLTLKKKQVKDVHDDLNKLINKATILKEIQVEKDDINSKKAEIEK